MSVEASGEAVIVYEAADGELSIDVRLERETVWLTQRQMGEVFRTSTDNVGLHLRNVFADGELQENGTTENFSVVRESIWCAATRCTSGGWPNVASRPSRR